MRCIEITISVPASGGGYWINRNMRCIEILQYFEVSYLNKKQYFKILHQRLYGISKIQYGKKRGQEMLNIFYGDMKEAVYNTAGYFKYDYEDEWIVDPFVKKMHRTALQ